MFQLKKRFLIILNLLALASSVWTPLPQIRTGTFQPITTLTSPSSNITTVTVSYVNTSMALNPVKWGLGIVGYKSYLTLAFSFNVKVTTFTDTSITVAIQPEDSTYIYSLRMMYIVSSFAANTTIQIIQGCFKCLLLSQQVNFTNYPGDRSQPFYQNSLMTYHPSIQSRAFLYSFNYSNKLGQTINLQVTTSLNPNATYTHTVSTTQYNNVNYVCISVLSWVSALNSWGAGKAAFFDNYRVDYQNQSYSNNLESYTQFNYMNLFFMGIYRFSHRMGGQRQMGIYPQRYSDYKLITNFDRNIYFQNANIHAFYIGSLYCTGMVYENTSFSCSTSCSSLRYAAVSGICQPCNPECLTCNSTNPSNCTSCYDSSTRQIGSCICIANYFSVSSDMKLPCVLCNTILQYCANCTNTSYCLSCIDSSVFANINGTCYCRIVGISTYPTYYVTGVCLTFPGCINATIFTNARVCKSCNPSANFQMASATNFTCICMKGYNNNGTNKQTCIPECGDGTVNGQGCDDGNKVNGDGCSQNCTVETGWICLLPSGSSGPSSCVKKSFSSSNSSNSSNTTSASLTYLYAYRVIGTNTAYLYFTFYPSGTGMTSTAFQNAIATDPPISVISSNYNNLTSRVILLISFTDNIESNNNKFVFSFTSAQYYFTDPVTVYAITQGINEQLIFLSYGPLIKTMQYVIMGTAFIGIVIGVVSALAGYKLMGLQLLLPMQAGYFASFGMKNLPPYISSIKGLEYSLGFNQLVPYNYEKYVGTNSKFAKYDFQIEMALNLNVMAAVLMLATVILLILQIIYLYKYSKAAQQQKANAPPPVQTKKNKKNKKQQKVVFQVKEEGQSGLQLKSSRSNRNVFVNNFYFYIAAFISQQAIFCFIIQCSQFGIVDFYLSEDINLMTGYIVLLLMIGNLIFLLCQMDEKKDRRIITFQETRIFRYPIHLILTSLLITLAMGMTFTFSFAPYIAAALSFLPLIGLIYFKPYRHQDTNLNAFSAFINLAFPLVASAAYLVNNIMSLPEMGWLLSIGIIIFWQFATETTMIIRMVKTIPWKELPLFQRCLEKKKKEENLLDKNKGDVEMTSIMKNSIKGDGVEIVDWQVKNKKEYESICQKPENQDQEHASDHNQEEDELVQIKKRLKKEIMMKKAY